MLNNSNHEIRQTNNGYVEILKNDCVVVKYFTHGKQFSGEELMKILNKHEETLKNGGYSTLFSEDFQYEDLIQMS